MEIHPVYLTVTLLLVMVVSHYSITPKVAEQVYLLRQERKKLGIFVGTSIYRTFWPTGTVAQINVQVALDRLHDQQRQHAAGICLAGQSEETIGQFTATNSTTLRKGEIVQAPGSLTLTGDPGAIKLILDTRHPGISLKKGISEPEKQQTRVLVRSDSMDDLLEFFRVITSHGVECSWRALIPGQQPKQHSNSYDI